MEQAAANLDDKTIVSTPIETTVDSEEANLREDLFFNMMSATSMQIEDALTNGGNDNERFGKRVGPAVVRAYEQAVQIAASAPDKRQARFASVDGIYSWAHSLIEYMPTDSPRKDQRLGMRGMNPLSNYQNTFAMLTDFYANALPNLGPGDIANPNGISGSGVVSTDRGGRIGFVGPSQKADGE